MDLASLLQPISIMIELLVFLLGIALAVRKGRTYGWFIAFTFGVYIVYDSLGYVKAQAAPGILALLFLAGSISILYAVWMIYQEEPGTRE